MIKDYAFDIECFPNFFSISFENMNNDKDILSYYIWFDTVTNEVHNDYQNIISFISNNYRLIGYNCLNYDCPLLAFIQLNTNTFNNVNDMLNQTYFMSQRLIKYDWQNSSIEETQEINQLRYFKHQFTQIDIMKILRHDKLKKSLKQTLININYPIIQSLPKLFNEIVTSNEIDLILKYNRNDVNGTKVLAKFINNEILMKYTISKKYNIDLINTSRSGMADKILATEYSNAINVPYSVFKNNRTYHRVISIGETIDKRIYFSTPELKDLLRKLIETNIVSTTEINYSVLINNVTFNIGTGGLHSKDRPGKFKVDNDTEIIDVDVNSFYPYLIINLGILPAHLNPVFLKIIKDKTEDRIKYKKLGKTNLTSKLFANGLKITINSIFGGFNSEYKFWSDRKCLVKTTINGQLLLLMLIESLTKSGFNVISANTDGIITIVSKSRKDLYLEICKTWSERFNFSVEYTNYTKYIRRDVNCYLAQTIDGKIKYKGDMNPNNYKDYTRSGSFPGFDRPIISIALSEYFINNIPIEKTITEYISKPFKKNEDAPIYMYCSTQKADKKFNFQLYKIVKGEPVRTTLQKDLRFYISNNGGRLFKVNKENNNSISSLFKDYLITPFNNYKKSKDYKINFTHYIIETQNIINIIESGNTNKKKIRENLFNYKLNL